MKRLTLFALIISLIFSFAACDLLETASSDGYNLEVHFIDVGQADSTLVLCDGESLLIDGGNAADSSLIYSYLRDREINYLDYIIATHPHEDHIGGLAGALSYAKAGVCYSSTAESDSKYFETLAKKLAAAGAELKVPSVGDSFDLGGAKITFLGPVEYFSDENENSLVCRLEYGDTSFLFTGDAGKKSEKLILKSGRELESTVLKVGHHGSENSACYEFLRAVNPQYAVISTEYNSQYGHPHESTLSRLSDAGAAIYRTDKNGTVIFHSDGTVLTAASEKGSPEYNEPKSEPEQADKSEPMYIGNISSEKYHLTTCKGLPDEKNRIYFYTLEEALNSGFAPCGRCKPDVNR